ncbi:S1C family serine protease [Cellulomonas endometrii]|uniref:S1C family serine protease n=1 Tax=Cellulomonas endometrii TaxID=3036301 RepID=UPI0024AD467D|nr:trypsin-like peptidase domain-containing protein [Cellulomonas endometrii]
MDQHDPASPADSPATTPPAAEPYRPPRRVRRRRTAVALVASGTVAAGLVLGGSAVALGWPDDTSGGTGLTVAPRTGSGDGRGTTDPGATTPGSTAPGSAAPSTGLPGTGSSATGTATLDTTTATPAQQAGVVLISTVLGYQSAEAAGTGVVLTSDGLVVTNNHVVQGATQITVTVGATGESFTATVVGTDAAADVAVLQLDGAAGLTTAPLDDDDAVALGDAVTAVGNAEGGGILIAADGSITGLEESITTQSEGASAGESLTGLVEVDADVVPGDSGGPLLDDEGEVIGITTAASSGSADITGYAIPIGDVLDVVTQIVAGQDTDAITLGYPAFLGVQIATAATTPGAGAAAGATIAGVIEGTPAAQAGLAAGDTVTAVDGTPVADGDALSAALAGYAPGDRVTLTWTAADGGTRSATVTLVAGPAD